ncbi:MAG: RNA 2',3'-cyclic phosphodiesterase [Alphaproteobacteria bacterium]|nr:RNA 2',3'-cyclic phosphodiesterase [Alphaproteobacteria bacterium]MBV9370689.1 RNA 2',3'-cyclic phosphodiesterase [Alphaproteobacteria bacterium]MBV9899972.1 RNA 2',3'-cyclic phosphodiesterase [Alphaproteobacteria bacterium]
MQRLFVGLRPPAVVRERLLGLMGGVAGARWQGDDQLHLTLRFIGEVDRHAARDVDAALGAVHHPAFALALAGIGAFERRGEPAVLWVGVSPPEPVAALHRKIEQALGRVGLEPDRRAYRPHITLARLPRGTGSIAGALEASGRLAGPPFDIGHFCLFESRFTPDGPVYSILERYPLSVSR